MIANAIAAFTFVLAPPVSQDLAEAQTSTTVPVCVEQSVTPAGQGCSAPLASPQAPPAPPPAAPPPDSTSGGDIVVTGRLPSPADPLAKINAKSFEATQAVDKAFVGPVAMAYQHDVPSPIRSGLRNFLRNLHEPVVFLNYLLQLKPGKGAETLGRFVVNTTIGAAGLFDMAKRHPFNLPYRPNGLADTLGYYGVKPGPFFFLPLIGPTTLRDLLGNGIDRLVLPLGVGRAFKSPYYNTPANIIRSLDHRAEFDEQLAQIRNADDPYVAARTYYLRQRQAEIDALHHRSSPKPSDTEVSLEGTDRQDLLDRTIASSPPEPGTPDGAAASVTSVRTDDWGSGLFTASHAVSRPGDDGV